MKATIELSNQQVAEIVREHIAKRIVGRVISLSPSMYRDVVTEVISFDGYKIQVEIDEKPVAE